MMTFGSGARNVSMNWTNAPFMNFPDMIGSSLREISSSLGLVELPQHLFHDAPRELIDALCPALGQAHAQVAYLLRGRGGELRGRQPLGHEEREAPPVGVAQPAELQGQTVDSKVAHSHPRRVIARRAGA